MTVDEAILAFTNHWDEDPTAQMQWVLDNWASAGPRMVKMLDDYAFGRDQSDETIAALYVITRLIGDAGDTAAFPALCQLLHDAQQTEEIIGLDAMGEYLPGILIKCFDGNIGLLMAALESEATDEFLRADIFAVIAVLARDGRIPDFDMHDTLLRLFADLRPRGANCVWMGWADAVAIMGYEDLAPQAETLFADKFVDPEFMLVDSFRTTLHRQLAGDDLANQPHFQNITPFTDAIATMKLELPDPEGVLDGDDESGLDRESVRLEAERLLLGQQRINPFRGVGRNDPCPCGSGKKFKKCCIPA